MTSVENFRIEKFFKQRSKIADTILASLQRNDYAKAADILECVVEKGIANPDLWHCRTFFRELPPSVVRQRPLLLAGMVMLHWLGHHGAQAVEWLERLQALRPCSPLRQAQVACLTAYLALHMQQPGAGLLPLLRRTGERVRRGELQLLRATLTAQRPSVLNGMFDLSRYQKHFPRLRQPLEEALAAVYGDTAHAAVDMLQAEICYQQNRLVEAFSLASSAVNVLNRYERGADMLFTAMYIVLEVLLFTGQIKACEAAVLNLRGKVVEMGAFHLLPGVTALQVWAGLYKGERDSVRHWLAHEAPDENGDYNRLESFVYFRKVRAYLALEQPVLALGLCERLRPLLNGRAQPMLCCELDMLLGLAHAQMEAHEQAFACLERCLPLGERYGYYRLFADEGECMRALLQRYMRRKKSAGTPFLHTLLRLTQEVGTMYPGYLRSDKPGVLHLTGKQLEALRLAASHCTNAQIAAHMQISQNAVTGYFRRIFAALGVSSRHQAVEVARRRGVLRP